MARTFNRSPLALAVLGLLYEAPMHPYRMQQLIKERGKDKVINVQRRASLYQTISQLEKAGLITVKETVQDENRPERTIYALTDRGQQTIEQWLRDMLSTPTAEFPEFPAAISFLPLLTPDDALRQLEKRETALAEMLTTLDSEMQHYLQSLPRLVLLEEELLRATYVAELEWVRSIIDDLRTERLTWNNEMLRKFLSDNASDR
ncbi:MAG TPA: PadR family transcriptional regulator [Oceanobacillus sp.]|nr:PadR family transcriptional regulator [Oceanobacillus sp.]